MSASPDHLKQYAAFFIHCMLSGISISSIVAKLLWVTSPVPWLRGNILQQFHKVFIAGQTVPIEEEEPALPPVPAEKIIRDPGQAYLAMCLGVKDQNEDLREWIRYHQSLGVGKFYVFDDSSIVPAAEDIQDLIQEGKEAAAVYCSIDKIGWALLLTTDDIAPANS